MTGDRNTKTTLHRFKGVEWIFMNLPFVCYLALLGVLYIYNTHSVESDLRKIEALKKEVKDSEWEYMTLKKEIMYGSTPTQMAKRVKELGIGLEDDLPEKISVKTD